MNWSIKHRPIFLCLTDCISEHVFHELTSSYPVNTDSPKEPDWYWGLIGNHHWALFLSYSWFEPVTFRWEVWTNNYRKVSTRSNVNRSVDIRQEMVKSLLFSVFGTYIICRFGTFRYGSSERPRFVDWIWSNYQAPFFYLWMFKLLPRLHFISKAADGQQAFENNAFSKWWPYLLIQVWVQFVFGIHRFWWWYLGHWSSEKHDVH